MSSRTSWNKPDYIAQLMRGIAQTFGINYYRDKSPIGILPSRFLSPLRNFQWVTGTESSISARIARCAQPNYRSSDQEHEFKPKQLKFLQKNNIKTIISFNSERLKPASHFELINKNIWFRHFPLEDFTALSLQEHQAIDNLVQSRSQFGAILFYCGYGQGRTGTGIAGYILKTIMLSYPTIFRNASSKKLHEFLGNAFGVEQAEQTRSIMEYLKSLATVEPAPQQVRPRTLSSVKWANFTDDNEHLSQRPLPPLPDMPPTPPPKIPRGYKPHIATHTPLPIKVSSANQVSMQSLNPIGNLQNTYQPGYNKVPGVAKANGAGLYLELLQDDDSVVNRNSFYFDRVSF